jgi:hypothetical protein
MNNPVLTEEENALKNLLVEFNPKLNSIPSGEYPEFLKYVKYMKYMSIDNIATDSKEFNIFIMCSNLVKSGKITKETTYTVTWNNNNSMSIYCDSETTRRITGAQRFLLCINYCLENIERTDFSQTPDSNLFNINLK